MRRDGYVLIVVSISMVILFSTLHLGFFILRNRVKEDGKIAFIKRENQSMLNEVMEYERGRIEKMGVEYLTGQEKIWTMRDGRSPGRYTLWRVRQGSEDIYEKGDGFIASEKMHLNLSATSTYRVYLEKNMGLKDRDIRVQVVVEVEYLPKNLDHGLPDRESYISIEAQIK